MNDLHQKGRGRFDLPPSAEKHLVWYGFIKRLPTTIFWASLGYLASFALLTLILWMREADLNGVWLWLYYLGAMIFVAAGFLFLAGWQSRTME